MALFGCEGKLGCTCKGFIASLIIGVIAAILRYTAVITVTPAFLWTVFGIAVVYLGFALIASALAGDGRPGACVCSTLSTLLAAILGTALFAVVLLAIEFAATSILGAILVGVLLFFFSLTLTSTACLVKCYAKCRTNCTD